MNGRKFMMASASRHKVLSTSDGSPEDLCLVYSESPDYYIGSWVYTIGMFNVAFPKTSTRELTPDERKKLRGKYLRIAFSDPLEIAVDEERPLVQLPENPDWIAECAAVKV